MKREVKWGSPKHYQAPRTVMDDVKDLDAPAAEPIVAKRQRHGAKYCKFFKGPHQYTDWEVHHYPFEQERRALTGRFVRYCKKCRREERWYAPYRHGTGNHFFGETNLAARPPDYKEPVDTISA